MQPDNVLISCIIPMFNVEHYIKRTITSLRCQTYSFFEIIIMDDCSTDKSVDIVRDFVQVDPRIKLYISDHHIGAARSRNEGIRYAKGDYILFLDSDDEFSNTLFSDLYSRGMVYGPDLIIFGYKRVFEGEDQRSKDTYPLIGTEDKLVLKKDIEYIDLRLGDKVPWNKCLKRSFLVENGITFQDIPSNNDVFFSFCSILSASSVRYLHCLGVTHYSNRIGSITNMRRKGKNGIIAAISRCVEWLSMYSDLSANGKRAGEDDMYQLLMRYFLTDKEYSDEAREADFAKFLNSKLCNWAIDYSDRRIGDYHMLQDFVFLKLLSEGRQDANNSIILHQYRDNINKLKIHYIHEIIVDAHKKGKAVAFWGLGQVGKTIFEEYYNAYPNELPDYLIDEGQAGEILKLVGLKIHSFQVIEDKIDIIFVTVINPIVVEQISNEINNQELFFW